MIALQWQWQWDPNLNLNPHIVLTSLTNHYNYILHCRDHYTLLILTYDLLTYLEGLLQLTNDYQLTKLLRLLQSTSVYLLTYKAYYIIYLVYYLFAYLSRLLKSIIGHYNLD